MEIIRLRNVLIVALVVGLYGCGFGRDLSDVEYLERGKRLFDEHDYPAAAIEVKNALQKNPNNISARVLLGRTYLEIGYGEGAEKEFRKARELGLENKEYLPVLARALLMQHRHRELIEINADIPTRSIEYSEFVSLQGMANLELGDFTAARKLFEIALEVDPRNIEALIGKARDAGFHGNFDESRKYLTQALEIDPDNAIAWRVLGDLDKLNNDFEKAEGDFTEAINKHFYNRYDLLQRADVRIKLKKYDAALEDVDKLKKRFPKDSSYNYPLGLILFSQGKIKEAIEPLSVAASFNAIAKYYLALANLTQGNEAEAERLITQVVAREPRLIASRLMLARFLMRRGEYDKVISLVKPVVGSGQANQEAVKILAGALVRGGRPEDAVKLLEDNLTEEPKSLELEVQLATALIAAGREEQGMDMLRSIIAANPEFEPPYVSLAMSLIGLGDFEAAKGIAEEFRGHFKESVEPINLIGIIDFQRGDLPNAEKRFLEVLRTDSNNVTANSNLAAIAVRRGELGLAKELYQGVLEKHPNNSKVLIKLSEIYEKQGDADGSVGLLENAIKVDPASQIARARLANMYLEQGRPEDAKRVISTIDEKKSGYLDALRTAIKVDLAINANSDAFINAEKLVRLTPSDPRSYYFLALAQGGVGDREGMIKSLERAQVGGGAYMPAKIAYGRVLLRSGEIDRARAIYSQIPQQDRTRSDGLAFEAEIAAADGEYEKAVTIYKDIYEKSLSRDVLGEYVSLLEKMERRGESIKVLSEWVDKHPDDDEFLIVLAAFHSLENDGKDREIYEKVVEKNPRNVIALNNLAWSLRKENLQRAIGYAQIAHNIAPRSSIVNDTLGVLLTRAGDYARAADLFNQAMESDPKNPEYQFHYAELLAAEGNGDKAIPVLRKVLATDRPFNSREKAKQKLLQLSNR